MSRRSVAACALVAAATSGALIPAASVAQEPTPHFTATNGSVECWGRHHTATLWHFIVFNDGTATGRYTVEVRRDADDELTTYTRKVRKNSGVNDGLVIPAGKTIDYVRISSDAQGTIFLRHDVPGHPRCSS